MSNSTVGPPSAFELSAADALPSAAYALARRFSAGATLWCLAPTWPEHGRHVAVEFVHPVIVGTRALAAVSVSGPDPVAALRAVVRSGDAIVMISSTTDPIIAEVLKRAPAWGATTIWVAAGPAVPGTPADVTVRIDDASGTAAFDGRLVLQYHLLWELAHVCFEHPGLLEPRSDRDVDADGADEVCVTCRDEGRLAEVIRADVGDPDAFVRTATGTERVDVSLLGPLAPNDLVLVHGGAAITEVP